MPNATRETLARGGVVSGEEFDNMLEDERNEKSILHQLVEIKKTLDEIAAMLGKKECCYADNEKFSSQ